MTMRHDREPQLIDAITELKSDARVSIIRDGSIVWHDSNPSNITDEQIQTKLAEIQAEYDAQEYARSRKTDYPDIGDQLDALYHAGVFPANMAARIKETKDKYPK